MRVIECVQGSPEWREARRGIPTASNFDRIITPVQGKPSGAQWPYICELLAERYLGVTEPYQAKSGPMAHGTETEHQARLWYSMSQDCEVKQVGFCLSDCGRWGCSPDGLVGDDGLLELKCPTGKTQMEWLLAGTLPVEYKAQAYGQLVVTGRMWCDFVSYCPGLPPLIVNATFDDLFVNKLHTELLAFSDRLALAHERIKELEGK